MRRDKKGLNTGPSPVPSWMQTQTRSELCGVADVDVDRMLAQLNSGETVRLVVDDDAMRPHLRAGEVIRVRRSCAKRLRFGDIVVVLRDGRPMLRRVVWRSENRLWTKCDQDWPLDDPLQKDDVIGRVVSVGGDSGKDRELHNQSTSAAVSLGRAAIHHVGQQLLYHTPRLF